MERYPILFGRHELIEGNGFIARVSVNGHALLFKDGEEYCVEGVNPGGFSARGAHQSEALAAFCEEFRVVLFDIALDAQDFESFKAEVESFFHDTNETARREWEDAVAEVRSGRVTVDWLIKRPAESPCRIDVALISQPQAANNEEGGAAIAA